MVVAESPEAVFVNSNSQKPAGSFCAYSTCRVQASYTGDSLQTVANFKILPYPSTAGGKFVLDQTSPQVLIADEVGLGKTIEAALVYQELKARGMVQRVLIVAPSGLCLQWQEEMRQKFGEDFAIYDRRPYKP